MGPGWHDGMELRPNLVKGVLAAATAPAMHLAVAASLARHITRLSLHASQQVWAARVRAASSVQVCACTLATRLAAGM